MVPSSGLTTVAKPIVCTDATSATPLVAVLDVTNHMLRKSCAVEPVGLTILSVPTAPEMEDVRYTVLIP